MNEVYFYPNDPDALFYAEFWERGLKPRSKYFSIFKKNFQPSLAHPILNPLGEMHPWNLLGGEVHKDSNAEYLFTEPYIKAIVDGLNLLSKHITYQGDEFTKEEAENTGTD